MIVATTGWGYRLIGGSLEKTGPQREEVYYMERDGDMETQIDVAEDARGSREKRKTTPFFPLPIVLQSSANASHWLNLPEGKEN